MSPAQRILDRDDVGPYLHERLLITDPGIQVSELSGGVSGRVFLAEAGGRRLVVKQPLSRLAVTAEWWADTDRAQTEARAIRWAAEHTPGACPELVYVDTDNDIVTMLAAPDGWTNWRDALLGGAMNPAAVRRTATWIGEIVGQWHADSWGRSGLADSFNDYQAFEDLRITPFHREVSVRHPELEMIIGECVDQLLSMPECLVHGDLSPKNILVGTGGSWIIDFEVAHFGAAVFDLAFLQCHLMLKSIHQPERGWIYAQAAEDFMASYRGKAGDPPSAGQLPSQIGCLLLARVDGMSPAGYLSARERSSTRCVAQQILTERGPSLQRAWRTVLEVRP